MKNKLKTIYIVGLIIWIALITNFSALAQTQKNEPKILANSKSIKVAQTPFKNNFQKKRKESPFTKTNFATRPLQGTLIYSAILQQVIDKSYDLKMSKLDIDISKAELKAVRADLFPTIYTQFNTEYNNGLGNPSNINYVGNTVVSTYTQYRNLISLGMQYNLFDFGAINKHVLMAKKEVEAKKVSYELQVKDLKLKVLDLYTKILEANNEIKTKGEVLLLYEQMFKNKERMFKAGVNDKISVMDEAVKIARTQDDIEKSKLDLKNNLADLTSLTQQKYDANSIDVLGFDEMNIPDKVVAASNSQPLQAKVISHEPDLSFNPNNSLEAKFYDFEIEGKKAEYEMYKRQRYPAFKFYTNYLLYGQDPNNYGSAYSDFKQASIAFGISGSFAFFDGFKNKANKEKAALELKRLQWEKEKKLNDIETAYEKSYGAYSTYTEDLAIKQDLLHQVKEKLNAINRMSKNGLAESNDVLTTKADLLTQEYELEKNIIDISSKIKEIEIMAGKDQTGSNL